MIVRWHKDQEYCIVRLYQDLVGDWVITQCWGHLQKDESEVRHLLHDSYQAALETLREINRSQRELGFKQSQKEEVQLTFDLH